MAEQRLIDANPLVKGMKGRLKSYEKEYGYLSDFVSGYEEAIDDVVDTPTVEAKPVVHAHWIYHMDDLFPAESTQECSHCHIEVSATIEAENYCPSCGAQMDEEFASDNNVGSKTEDVKIPVISMEDVPKLMEEMEK